MVLNCIIADDDKTSQAVLKAFIKKHDQLNLMGVAGNGKQALNLANKYDLNLVFLDISMPIMNGFEFLDHLERNTDLKVILVTSEREYALKAFEYNISDYLLKPISRHRFRQAIDWIVQSANTNHVYKRISKRDLLIRDLIQVMISSNTDVIHPEPSAESPIGYYYPIIESNMSFDNPVDMLRILEIAEGEGILSGTFVHVVRLCRKCSNHTFSIEEPGSDYNSLDLEKDSRVLKAKCGNCQNIQDIDQLHREELKEYRLTEMGKRLAEGNLYFKNEHLQGETNSEPE